MSSFMWKATVRNVNRALKEVNAFEWEGDYRPAAREALKRILEDEVEKTPVWAEAISGIPAETIANLAREYASTKPAAITAGYAAGY